MFPKLPPNLESILSFSQDSELRTRSALDLTQSFDLVSVLLISIYFPSFTIAWFLCCLLQLRCFFFKLRSWPDLPWKRALCGPTGSTCLNKGQNNFLNQHRTSSLISNCKMLPCWGFLQMWKEQNIFHSVIYEYFYTQLPSFWSFSAKHVWFFLILKRCPLRCPHVFEVKGYIYYAYIQYVWVQLFCLHTHAASLKVRGVCWWSVHQCSSWCDQDGSLGRSVWIPGVSSWW